MKHAIYKKIIPFKGRAVDVLDIFKGEPFVFLLESSIRNRTRGRYSFIGFSPFETVTFKYQKGKDSRSQVRRAFTVLREKFKKYGTDDTRSGTPFPCGMMGYMSYDFGLPMENILSGKRDDAVLPDYLFGMYDAVLTVDHFAGKIIVTSTGLPEKAARLRHLKARERLAHITEKLTGRLAKKRARRALNGNGENSSLPLMSNFTKSQYFDTVNKALEYIRRGDIYQVNLAQKFCLDVSKVNGSIKAFDIYELLGRLSPSCFGGYFDCRDFQIISSSPERFLSLTGRDVETRPMKGTRPRGKNSLEDNYKREELLTSPKEMAELLMITDLERNDLGRVCEFGSVRLVDKRTLEKYRTVYQATATVKGKLKKNKDCFDLLEACFPGGSITGCPKIRAMQIIEELEPSVRSLYTGSMGYISFNGNMDLNILIRTLLLKDKKIHFHVGGGIVSDSTPKSEYQETLDKARAITDCLKTLYH